MKLKRGYPRLAKGARLKIAGSGRDLVAQAFVGSSPTPRIIREPTKFSGFAEWLEEMKQCAPITIQSKIKILTRLSRHVNLWNSEAVDRHIPKANWTKGYKNNVINAYADRRRFKGFGYSPRKLKMLEQVLTRYR